MGAKSSLDLMTGRTSGVASRNDFLLYSSVCMPLRPQSPSYSVRYVAIRTLTNSLLGFPKKPEQHTNDDIWFCWG
jgi:hypothetical protein